MNHAGSSFYAASNALASFARGPFVSCSTPSADKFDKQAQHELMRVLETEYLDGISTQLISTTADQEDDDSADEAE